MSAPSILPQTLLGGIFVSFTILTDTSANLTEEQKEAIRFYTTNDYLLINGLLWKEDRDVIKEKIRIINEDGRAVMQEAVDQGFGRRWNCSDEEGELDAVRVLYQLASDFSGKNKVAGPLCMEALRFFGISG